MSVKHVLFILTNAAQIGPNKRPTGFYFPEVAHPFHEFDAAGYAIEFASLTGGSPPEDGYNASDPQAKAFRDSKAYQRMRHSRRLSEIDVTSYDAVFVPGGLGPMVDMAENPALEATLATAYEAGLIVGAVCHGPVALLNVRLNNGEHLLHGKRVTSFTNAEEDGYAAADVPFALQSALEAQGATFVEVDPWQPHAITDGRLVTGQNPASAGPVARQMLAAMA
ncbi:MAG: type 1 glutamine amidotransferase domain-containing protein [Myxococcota bacterium]